MTLADILKPSVAVLTHAEAKGLQLGAGLGTLIAIPGILIRPTLINPKDEPPLVAIANIAGVGAVAGATVVTLACAYKMSKLTKEGIIERAEKIRANVEQQSNDKVAAVGAGLGAGLVVARVFGLSKTEGKCVYGLLFRKQTAWELFAFGVMGAALGAGVFIAGKKVCAKIEERRSVEVNEVDEGDAITHVKDAVDDAKPVDKDN